MQVENQVKGAMTALITPFKNALLDLESYESLIRRQIQYGIDVIVPVGTTGESATLSHKEHKECIEVAVSVCKASRKEGHNVKVLAGVEVILRKKQLSLLNLHKVAEQMQFCVLHLIIISQHKRACFCITRRLQMQ